MPRGDISAVKSKAKNGKSFLESILVSGLFGYRGMGIKMLVQGAPKVLYFDTEQARSNTAKMAKRIYTMSGWDINYNKYDLFRMYSLRTMSTDERVEYIKKEIGARQPDFVVIDGISDLIEDFNNIEQSNNIVGEMMRLSAEYNWHISCVLHTNKSAQDSNMRGHLGTILLNKASDVFEVD